MRTRTILASLIIVAAVGVFAATLAHALFLSPSDETSGAVYSSVAIPPSERPVRLQIPSLGIDAAIQYVGVAKSGNMAVPTNYTDVGWFRQGTVPGQIGSAVIDGHVDNGFGLAAVFKRLSEIKEDDDIYIITETGRKLHFKVEEIGHYKLADVPLQKLFDRTDTARLNLITCEGTWIPSKKMYDERMVVYSYLAT